MPASAYQQAQTRLWATCLFQIFAALATCGHSFNITMDAYASRIHQFHVCLGVETATCLLLPCLGEIAHTLEIANDSRHIVYVGGMAVRAFVQITLVYVATIVADCIRDVEREVIASFLCCNAEQLAVLSL